jgi:DNA (cytosine-5)-methyltransferase 1
MSSATRAKFKFVDLFAGIGGFHAALSAMGGKCVYAVEIDPDAARIYEQNWGINPLGDVTVDANDDEVRVPEHDVLVAGFPCQPFSKSGYQRGMDETRGTLYWNILRIIEERRPAIVLLENVRNLAGPRHAHEWDVIVRTLREEGYRIADRPAVFSPHLLPRHMGGRPQVRERVFITATRVDELPFSLDAEPVVSPKAVSGWHPGDWSIEDLPLQPAHHVENCDLTDSERLWIEAWNDFVELMWEVRKGTRLPGFPLWADSWIPMSELKIDESLPPWKMDFLRKNAQFYTDHRKVIDRWTSKWGIYGESFPASRRKLEWQAQDTANLWQTVMHMRPSGIRAKAPTYVPALVAITQTSIIGSRERRLSPREAARLQGLPDWFSFEGQKDAATYRQLGNGVSVGAVWHVLRAHAARDREILKKSHPRLLKAIESAPDSPDDLLANMNSSRQEPKRFKTR